MPWSAWEGCCWVASSSTTTFWVPTRREGSIWASSWWSWAWASPLRPSCSRFTSISRPALLSARWRQDEHDTWPVQLLDRRPADDDRFLHRDCPRKSHQEGHRPEYLPDLRDHHVHQHGQGARRGAADSDRGRDAVLQPTAPCPHAHGNRRGGGDHRSGAVSGCPYQRGLRQY